MPQLHVNGSPSQHDAQPDTPLRWVLREQFGPTGTQYRCGAAQCGASAVHVDGAPLHRCAVPVSTIEPKQKITNIESLSPGGSHAPSRRHAGTRDAAGDSPAAGRCGLSAHDKTASMRLRELTVARIGLKHV